MALLLGLGFWQLGEGAWIPAKAWLAQSLMQSAWRRSVDGDSRAAPWPWADTWPVARLTLPQRDIDLIVLSGGSGRVLAFGPGHMRASVLPGEPGNAVIAGHRDTHFRFLAELAPGDSVYVERPDGERYDFDVIAIDIVDSRRSALRVDADIAMLTLVTCYPFDTLDTGGPLRYVVTARRRMPNPS